MDDAIPTPLIDLIPRRSDPLFDDDSATETHFDTGTPTITWSLPEPATAAFYTLTSGHSEGDPTAWRLEASTDGTAWSVLDERTDQSFVWRRQTRPFTIAAPDSYLHYRLVITASTSVFSLSEIELLT
jgi:hypothetical protein